MSVLEPYWADSQVTVHLGDCLDVLPSLPDGSVDAVVTDPPYGLTELPTDRVVQALSAWLAGDRTHVPGGRGFMGREWDKFVPPPGVWDECLRVMKPGAYLLAFASPRTQDLMGLSIRLAGFEIRDGIKWIYGQGMPHGLNVAKAIASGGGRPEDIRRMEMGEGYEPSGRGRVNYDHGGGSVMNGSTAAVDLPPEAARWEGWSTELKPSHEPVVMARKPLAGTVAANIQEYGTGALNVDGCRVGTETRINNAGGKSSLLRVSRVKAGYRPTVTTSTNEPSEVAGRWPPNILLEEEMAAELDTQSGVRTSGAEPTRRNSDVFRGVYGEFKGQRECVARRGASSGGASRFFPVFRFESKAASAERPRLEDGTEHNTVKPLSLIRWLARLVTQPGGLILDPFAGSGTAGEAAIIEGFPCLLIDKDETAVRLIRERLRKDIQPDLFGGAA